MRRELTARYPFLQQDPPSGGSGDDPANNGDPSGQTGQGDPSPQDPPAQDPPQPFATFPDQDAFDKRMDREARRRLDDQAKQLGYESHKAMVDAAKTVKDQEAKQQTDLDREKAAREAAEQQRDNALRTANDRLIKAEVKMLITDPDISIVPEAVNDAYLLMAKDDIEVADDGSVSGVKEALKALVEAKPWLRVSDTQPRAVPASPRPAGQQSRQELIAAETEKLRRSGMYGI